MSTVNTTNVKNAASSTNNLVLGSSGDTQVQSLNTGQLAGLRNQLINGDFNIWQRGNSVTTPNSVRGYTSDRWNISNQSTGSIQLISDLPGFRKAFKYETTSSTVDIRQGVELPVVGRPCQFPIGSVWTLSFWVKSETTGGAAITAKLYASDDVSESANSIDVAGTFASLGTTTTAWQRISHTFTISSNPNFTNTFVGPMIRCSGTDTQLFCGVQLEPGPVATPFELRPIGLELSLCQRYFIRGSIEHRATGISTTDFDAGTTAFPTRMRTNPTVTIYSEVNVDASIGALAGRVTEFTLNPTTAVVTRAASILRSYVDGFITNSSGADLAAGRLYGWSYIADAEL